MVVTISLALVSCRPYTAIIKQRKFFCPMVAV